MSDILFLKVMNTVTFRALKKTPIKSAGFCEIKLHKQLFRGILSHSTGWNPEQRQLITQNVFLINYFHLSFINSNKYISD